MGNTSSNTYQPVPTVETEMIDQKQISLKRMQSSLIDINNQIASMQNSSDFSNEQKIAMINQKKTTETAIRLLQDPTVTFDAYKAEMGIAVAGGSKKSRSKKSRSKKSRSKKSRPKKSKRRH